MELKDRIFRTRHSSVSFYGLLLLLMTTLGICLVEGCSYSFTGASISPTIKTISIAYLSNNAQLVQPTLSRKLTEALKDKFTGQSNLSLVSSNGDLNIEGEITSYTTEPVAITGDQQSALQRLKITVNIRYTNKQDPKQDFESSFSRFEDYDARKKLSDVEDALMETINDALAQDIFNKALANW